MRCATDRAPSELGAVCILPSEPPRRWSALDLRPKRHSPTVTDCAPGDPHMLRPSSHICNGMLTADSVYPSTAGPAALADRHQTKRTRMDGCVVVGSDG